MSDIKYTIRKMEFPYWASETLARVEQLITGRNIPTPKQLDLANDLIKEFIFCECDRRGAKRTNSLNSLQELHLLDVLCEYFSSSLNETAKNAIFLLLFGGSDAPKRMKVLCKLTTMAISASIAPVLLAISVWLQQTGCSSPLALQLVQSVVTDYFILHPANVEPLKTLPKIAPQFVANFITAVVEIYLKSGTDGGFSPPPVNLLEMITNWVHSDPRLCLSAQLHPAVFPSGAIPMVAVSPLPGLIQWCALAPLYISENKDTDVELVSHVVPLKKIKCEKNTDQIIAPDNEAQSPGELNLYGKLHLGVLQSLYESKKPLNTIAIVNAQHLAQVVTPVSQRVVQLRRTENPKVIEKKLEVCLNRIAQAAQIALSGGCVFGNIQNFLCTLGTLPENRMLQIVIKTHQQLM